MKFDINPAKIWFIVKPSIGVPAFFIAIAITSLLIHTAVLTSTKWFPAFLNGNYKPSKVSSLMQPIAVPGFAQIG